MADPILAGIKNYRAADESLGTSGQPSVAQLRGIAEAGFTTVINLALHDDPHYSLPDEAGTVQSLSMAYVHIPVQFSAPPKQTCLSSSPPWRRMKARKSGFTARLICVSQRSLACIV
jgi:hypothetical protein